MSCPDALPPRRRKGRVPSAPSKPFPSARFSRARSCSTIRALAKRDVQVAGRVEGKVALIVGAGCVGPGWGNGRAAAVLFAREGAKVFAVDKNADSMTETVARIGNDGEIATHVCDVLEDAQVAAMTEACRKRFGRIDWSTMSAARRPAGLPKSLRKISIDRST